jgi:hypothetical protein
MEHACSGSDREADFGDSSRILIDISWAFGLQFQRDSGRSAIDEGEGASVELVIVSPLRAATNF